MNKTIEDIYRASLNFLFPLTTKKTYATIVSEAKRVLKAEHGSIFIEKNGVLQRVYSTVPSFSRVEPRKHGFSYKIYQTGKIYVLSGKQLHEAHPEFVNLKIKSFVLVPLSYKQESIGVLSLQSRKKEIFSEKKAGAVNLFGAMASLAIKKTQLYTEARRTLEARDLFISLAAHEMKTPLTTILGYSQLIEQKVKQDEMPELTWASELTIHVQRLTRMINELLQLENMKLDQLKVEKKKVSLRKILNSALRDFKANFPEHEIYFDDKLNGSDDMVKGDQDKLIQVVSNILNNAAKFSPKSSPVIVSLSRKASRIQIIIKDRGKGISRKDVDRIFEKYYKGQDNTKMGMGVGLFLAKNIISRHRGSISVKSRVNQGTEVEVALPKAYARTRT